LINQHKDAICELISKYEKPLKPFELFSRNEKEKNKKIKTSELKEAWKVLPQEEKDKYFKSKNEKKENKPKKPLSSFMLFCADARKKDGMLKANQLGEMWKKLTKGQREKYDSEYKQNKYKYDKENPKPEPEVDDKKKKTNSFILFSKEMREEGKSFSQVELGKMWKELSKEEREKYAVKAKEYNSDIGSDSESDQPPLIQVHLPEPEDEPKESEPEPKEPKRKSKSKKSVPEPKDQESEPEEEVKDKPKRGRGKKTQ